MQLDFERGRVWLVVVPQDLRAGFFRLAKTTAEYLHLEVTRGEDWVVFISRNGTTAKIIGADARGSVLITRKLHTGRFQQLRARLDAPAAEPLSVAELTRYLDGEEIAVRRQSLLCG